MLILRNGLFNFYGRVAICFPWTRKLLQQQQQFYYFFFVHEKSVILLHICILITSNVTKMPRRNLQSQIIHLKYQFIFQKKKNVKWSFPIVLYYCLDFKNFVVFVLGDGYKY